MYTEVKKCRICKSDALTDILNLGEQTLTGVFPKTKNQKITKGPIILTKCTATNGCGLVQMKHSYSLNEMYGENYGYRSGLNQSMVKHLQKLVESIQTKIKLNTNDIVIDIGSNDSTLLQCYPKTLSHIIGVDPTGEKFKKYYPEHIKLVADFFPCPKVFDIIGNKKAKVITSISMFYDLEDPQAFVTDVSKAIDDEGIWVFEQSYLPLMLKTLSFDTACHEHLEYYSLRQIQFLLKKADMKIIDATLNDINGGSFQVTAAKNTSHLQVNSENIQKLIVLEMDMKIDSLETWKEFQLAIENKKNAILSFLNTAKKNNEVVIGLGASTKGNVLLQYCNITSELMTVISEVNPDKFGSFTPQTLIPITSEADANKLNPKYKFVLPWHFKDTFIEREKEYLSNGGTLVFPMPYFHFVTKKDVL